jgi:hypothetical protein
MERDVDSLPGTRWAKKHGCTCPPNSGEPQGYGLWPIMDVTWSCPVHGLERILEGNA